MNNELKEKLLNSTSVKTTKMEATVCQACAKYNWKATQSVYYLDLNHNKYRELDVSATQQWKYIPKKKSKSESSITINILAEVKTMSGYHLVFDNLNPKRHLHFQSNYCDWIGYLEKDQEYKLLEVYTNQGFDKTDFFSLIDQFSEISYPNDTARIFKLLISPSSAESVAGSFRETNIGSEKELDNAVLWKSCQSLWSSIESFVNDNFQNFLSDFEIDMLLARQEDTDMYYKNTMEFRTSFATLFHPVIITSAKLWQINSEDESLNQLDSIRLYIQDRRGEVIRWFDVVHIDAFDSWIQDVTTQYETALSNVGAIRVN